VMANHRADELCAAAHVVAHAAQELGIAPEQRPTLRSAPLRRAA
jgi:hypothetical protein